MTIRDKILDELNYQLNEEIDNGFVFGITLYNMKYKYINNCCEYPQYPQQYINKEFNNKLTLITEFYKNDKRIIIKKKYINKDQCVNHILNWIINDEKIYNNCETKIKTFEEIKKII